MTCSAALLPAEGNLSSALCGAALSYAHCAAKCQVAPCQEQTAAICGKGEETVLDVRAAPHTLNTSCVICWCACVDGVTRPSQSLITEKPFPNMHRATVVVCILSIHLIHIKSMSSWWNYLERKCELQTAVVSNQKPARVTHLFFLFVLESCDCLLETSCQEAEWWRALPSSHLTCKRNRGLNRGFILKVRFHLSTTNHSGVDEETAYCHCVFVNSVHSSQMRHHTLTHLKKIQYICMN